MIAVLETMRGLCTATEFSRGDRLGLEGHNLVNLRRGTDLSPSCIALGVGTLCVMRRQ